MSLSRPHIILLIAANALCFLAVLLVVAVAGCQASPGDGTTYYVSPTGSDDASGRTPDSAWRSVTKVNSADVQPGDTVLFRGGSTYSDDSLMPEHSGSASSPIVYGSYGGGRAAIPQGIWFKGETDLTFQGLAINGAHQGINGTGDRITVEDSKMTNNAIGINAHGAGWIIRRNLVDNTGDSGMILLGTRHLVQRNVITDTGRDRSLDYGKHGIYLKSSQSRVLNNTIRRFSADGISSRLRAAVVSSNVISGGQIGIAWFQADPRSGTSRWSNNRISSVSEAGLYVSPSDEAGRTIENFVIGGNVVRTSATFMNLDTAQARTKVSCNTLLKSGSQNQSVCSARAAGLLQR